MCPGAKRWFEDHCNKELRCLSCCYISIATEVECCCPGARRRAASPPCLDNQGALLTLFPCTAATRIKVWEGKDSQLIALARQGHFSDFPDCAQGCSRAWKDREASLRCPGNRAMLTVFPHREPKCHNLGGDVVSAIYDFLPLMCPSTHS